MPGESISDNRLLLIRMRKLFDGITVPGTEMTIQEVDYGTGTTRIAFDVEDTMSNQLGAIQGGLVVTMLDACLGVAGAVKSGGILAMPLAEMKTSFIRPAFPGIVHGRGCTITLGRSIAFLEAELCDPNGKILARASGTAVPTPFPDT